MKKEFEYVVQQKFFNPEEVSRLVSIFNTAFEDTDAFRPYPNIVKLNSEQIVGTEFLRSVCRKIEAHFTDKLEVSDISLIQCWMVRSQTKDTDLSKLPYIPHFDKLRRLKGMIYLHDVNTHHGPIHFGKLQDPDQIDARRRKLPENYKEIGGNTIKENDLKSGMVPMEGKAGDVVFFDTNTAHCAGIVSEGFERHVIRFDFDVHGFNPSQSLVKRLVRFISSRLGITND